MSVLTLCEAQVLPLLSSRPTPVEAGDAVVLRAASPQPSGLPVTLSYVAASRQSRSILNSHVL